MIPKDHEEDLLTSGVNFLRAVTEAYGPEDGIKLWEGIATTIDAELKGKIFFAVLTGNFNSRIVLSTFKEGGNRVARIKALREVSGYGLKEAKDLDDALMDKAVPIVLEIKPNKRSDAVVTLRTAGYFV